MTFEQALPALKQGKKVRRKCWFDKHYYVKKILPNAFPLHYYLCDENDNAITICYVDILADDWEIVGEEQPALTYQEGYREGYRVGKHDGKKSIEKEIYERLRDICNEEIKKIDDERGE